MYLTITSDTSHEVLLQRELDGDELLDMDFFAREFAQEIYEGGISEGGSVLGGCGDFTVTLGDDPDPQAFVVWNSKSYFLAAE